MNKKSLIKASAIGIIFMLSLTLFFLLLIPFISNASQLKEKSFLGEDIRINLEEYNNYTLKIITPSNTFLKTGAGKSILFRPEEEGNYSVIITSSDKSESFGFEVVDNNNLSIKSEQEIKLNKENKSQDYPRDYNNKTNQFSKDLQTKITYNENNIYEKENNSEKIENPIIDKPFKWIQRIQVPENSGKITINVPKIGEDILIYKENKKLEYTIDNSVINNILEFFINNPNKEIILENESGDIRLEYITPGPKKTEKEISINKKEVTVYSPDGLDYQNVSSYAEIPELTNDKNLIKIFWKEENKYLDFTPIDTNDNSLFDKIEWIVPHLSNQTFEIIVITRAIHLDSNKNFISDIYDNVKELDDFWSEAINENEYLRVTFEKNLTSNNDITLYPKIISGNPKIEVYPMGSEDKIAEFYPIISNDYNKAYLTNLQKDSDVFDLKIIGGSVSFDYIIDPATLLRPDADGTYTLWTVSSGSDFSTTSDNSDASYISETNDEDRDTMNIQDLPSSAISVNNVTIIFRCRSYGNGNENVESGIYEGGTYSGGVDQSIATGSYNNYSEIYTTNPRTGNPWSVSEVNSMEAGVRLKQIGGTESVRCSEIYVSVDYNTDTTPPAITIVSPLIQNYSSTIIYFNVSLNENASWCGFSLDGTPNITMTLFNSTYFNFTNSTMTQGDHDITFSCNDTSGNMNSSSGIRYFGVDSIKPNVNLIYPLNSTYTINISELNYSYSDANSGYCKYSNSSGIWNSTVQTPGLNFTNVISKEGSNTWTVYCNDTVGNTNSSNVSFFKDTIFPIIQFGVRTLANATNVSQNFIYANVTITETNFANITFNLYNNTNGLTLVNSTNYSSLVYSINWTNLNDGIYYYNATVYDSVNHFNSTETRTITLDTHAPNATLLTPDNNSYENNATQNYTVNITDNIGLKNATLYIYNSTNNLVNQTTAIISGTQSMVGIVVTLTDGIYKWFYNVFDFSGNSFTTQNNTITVDTLNPNLILTYPQNTSYSNISAINYTYSDLSQGYCWYSNSSGLWNSTSVPAGNNFTNLISVEGSNTWIIYCNDSVGNLNYSSVTFEIDPNPLWLNLSVNTATANSTGGYSLTFTKNMPTTSYSALLSGRTDTDELYSISYYNKATTGYSMQSEDDGGAVEAGNFFWMAAQFGDYVFDGNMIKCNIGPGAGGDIIFSSNFLNTNYAVFANPFNDDDSPLINYVVGSKTVSGFQIDIEDDQGNNELVSETDYCAFSIGEYKINNNLLIKAGASTTIAGAGDTTVTFGSAFPDVNYIVIAMAEGLNGALCEPETVTRNVNSFTIHFQDDNNNICTNRNFNWIAIPYGNYIYDMFSPRINITYPSNMTYSTIQTSINYTVIGSKTLDSCWYSNSSGNWNSTRVDAGINWTDALSVEGVNNWTIYCNDSAGYLNYSKVNFYIDTTAPNATLISPENNSYKKNLTQNMTFNATDNVGLKNATLFIYNSTDNLVNQINISISGTQGVFGIVVTLTDGIYKWFYKIFDKGGNSFTTQNNTVTIHTIRPNVNLTYPINNILYTQDISNLNYTYFDTYPGYCWYSNNSGKWNSSSVPAGNNFTNVISKEGSNIWTVYCNDTAGNINSSTIIFIRDLLSTQINFTTPTPSDGTLTKNTNIGINITILETSLSEVKYNWNGTNNTIYNDSLILMLNLNNNSAFGEASNSNFTYDASSSENDGLCKNMGTGCNWTTGKYEKGLSFDGNDDLLNITNGDIIGTGANSVCAWIYPRASGGNTDRIIDNGNTIFIFDTANRRVRYVSDGTNGYINSATNAFNLDQWNYVCASRNVLGNVDIYVQGVLSSSGDSGTPTAGSTNLYIGNRQALGRSFTGIIDEIRIWGRTLSASEAYEMYVSNLQKYDSVQWFLYVNQSKNSTDQLDDGLYSYGASAKDINGAEVITEIRNITIHTILPNVNITYPLNLTYAINISALNYTYFDDYPGYCWYSNSSGKWNSSSVPAGNNFTNVISKEGNNTWTIYCNDSAKNINSINITFIKNTIPPTINLLFPLNRTYNINVSSLNYSVQDASGVNYCWYSNSSGLWNSSSVPAGNNFTNLISYEGSNTWTVYCNDSANYMNNLSVTFFKDTNAPNLTDISTTNIFGIINGNILIGENLTINATVFDSLGLNKVWTVIWQNVVGSNIIWKGFLNLVSGNLWGVTAPTNSTFPIGMVNYTVYANDSSGNQVNLSSNFTTIDNAPPYVTLISPKDGSFAGIDESMQNFIANFTENYRLQNSTLYIWNSEQTIINQTTTIISGIRNTTNISVILPSEGIYYWNYYACDYLENCNWSSTNYTLVYNLDIPHVEIIYPLNTNYSFNISNLNYSYNDSNPGYCWYSNSSGKWNSSSVPAGNNFTNVISKEGNNTWTVYCNNSAGNINVSSVTFYKDSLSPRINITYPRNISYNMILSTSNYTYIDATPGYCWYSNNSGIWNSSAQTPGLNFTDITFYEGSNNLTVYCNDSFGNFNSTIVSFVIDLTSPNATLIRPLNNTFNNTATQNLTLNATDNIKLSNATLYVYNSTDSLVNQTTTAITGTSAITGILYQFLYDGIFKWFYRVIDLAGNSFSTSNNTIIIDTVKPQVRMIYPENNLVYTENISTLNYTYNDLNADSCWYSNSSGKWNSSSVPAGNNFTNVISKEGNNTWTVYCNDSAKNINSSTINFIRDLFYPEISIIYPLNSTYAINVSTLNYTYGDANPGYCWYSNNSGIWNSTIKPAGQNFTDIITLEGFNTLTIYCNDTVNNQNNTNITFFKDTIYPMILFGEITDINNSNFTRNWIYVNVTAIELNELNISFNLYNSAGQINISTFGAGNRSINWTNLNDGIYYYNVTLRDVANNKNTTETRTITLDTHAPNGTLIPVNNTYKSNITTNFTLNATDNIGLKNATLYIYNSTNNLVNQTTAIISGTQSMVGIVVTLTDGIYKWFYNIFDFTGNSFTTQNNTITIDTIIPNLVLTYPQNTSYTINVSTLNYTYSDINPSRCWYSNSSGVWNSTTALAGTNFTNVKTIEGSNNFIVYCNDSAGNTNSTNVTFFKDSIPPAISITYPTNNTNYNINISAMNYTYFDTNSGYCWYSNSSGVWNSTSVSAGNNFTNLISYEGSNTWAVYCNDSTGNLNSSRVYFFKDTIIPFIAFGFGTLDNNVVIYQNYIFANVTINETNEANVTFYLYNDSAGATLINTTTYTNKKTINWTNLVPGMYFYNVTITDIANNKNFTETRSFNYSLPDFFINSTYITLNVSQPKEYESVLINATVLNLGGVDISSVIVRFYNGDPDLGGIQIGANKSISINKYSQNSTNIIWEGIIGSNNLIVVVDPPTSTNGSLIELNESNNKASLDFKIPSWSYFYGNILNSSIYNLADSINNSVEKWLIETIDTGNIYVTTSEETISWPDLQAIGKSKTNENTTNDFIEIDTMLGNLVYEDSISDIYTESGQIRETSEFIVFDKNIQNVPITNSTNNSNFITGIIWDTKKDTDDEFSEVDKENLIFVTKINKNRQGAYGTYDYELRIPAKLRDYNTISKQPAIFYAEIR